MLTWPPKDPQEVLDYRIDWSARLEEGETISTSTWTVPAGITKDEDENAAATATIWLSGGTLGETYELVNQIVTSDERTMDQTIRLRIKAK